MIRNLTTLGQALRMAFMAGAGYQKGDTLKKEDIDRWAKADISGGLLTKLERVCKTHDDLLQSTRAMADWTKAALNCKDWHWDGDQREAAEIELATALEVIAKAEGRS